MTVACYVEPERKDKSGRVMECFARGCGGKVVMRGDPEPGATDHVFFGNWSIPCRVIPTLRKARQPFWHIDNGWLPTGPGIDSHYYRITRNGMAPQARTDMEDRGRFAMFDVYGGAIRPWRKNGRKVLVCTSSDMMGKPYGINSRKWNETIVNRLKAVTDRPIQVRPKAAPGKRYATRLEEELEDAWCLVTHSSGAAVKAALFGVPVFCEPTCGAAPVGCTDLTKIETPAYPDNRREWLLSLLWQQFNKTEMRSGMAWRELTG